MKEHIEVPHPRELLKKPTTPTTRFNTWLAVIITKAVGSMWCAYAFFLLDLLMLPPVIKAHSVITWVTYIAQTVLQLILLPVIMVGQNVIQDQNDAKADADHQTLTYLATLQDRQMTELTGIKTILETLRRKDG
ncbi:MAG TPA: hypothetical protein VH234_02235 [Candidatus Saccharimonadales bacterium]|jgi:hypothetical protein|nr:hypothetical protein [Candidatus Saccharimonadales bacterium]